MKRIPYERLLLLLATILLLTISFTGIWSYSRLSEMTKNTEKDRRKDYRLILLRELNANLLTAENYTFSLMYRDDQASWKSDLVLLRYKSAIKINQLKGLPSRDTAYFSSILKLEETVVNRFDVLEALYNLQNENRVDKAMTRVVSEVKNLTKSSIQTPQPEKPIKKKRFFGNKKEPVAREKDANTTGINNQRAIQNSISEIQTEEVSLEKQSNVRKLQLEQKNSALANRFTLISQNIESRDKKIIQQEAQKNQETARETNIILVVFSCALFFFIGYVIYLVVVLLQKTKATTIQLQMAKKSSDQLAEAKSLFLANMSHELRTPLNAIVGFSEQLSQSKLDVEQQKTMEIIQKSATDLAFLTNEILDYSKIQSGAIQLELVPLSLAEEMNFIEQQMSGLFASRSNKMELNIQPTVPKYILGDPLRIRQIILNLVSNANKFTQNGTIQVEILVQPKSNKDWLEFSVSDTGIGIEKEHINRIFEAFEQAETSTTRNFGGTGLGLSITKQLVQLMSGSITVSSEIGKGTRFVIQIPLIPSNQIEVKQPKSEFNFSFLSGKTIAIVDDEPYNRALIVSILKGNNIQLLEAENGEEALQLVKNHEIDVMLLDMRMPILDGLDTFEAIKKNSANQFPIIATTAAIREDERLNLINNGWDDVLLKPLQLELFFNSLKTVVTGIEQVPDVEKQVVQLPLFHSLRMLSGEDQHFYKEMIETFIRTTQQGCDEMRLNRESISSVQIAEIAHKLSSPVKHVGDSDSYLLLKSLEKVCREQEDSEIIEPLIAQTIHSLEKLIIEAKQEIDTINSIEN